MSNDDFRMPNKLSSENRNWARQFVSETEPKQAIESNEQFVSLSLRGTSGERAGERADLSASSPRPSPPSHGRRGRGCHAPRVLRWNHMHSTESKFGASRLPATAHLILRIVPFQPEARLLVAFPVQVMQQRSVGVLW